jgi:ppGpp synthetase/RelA/SpoT-type nucleotidyltranferase
VPREADQKAGQFLEWYTARHRDRQVAAIALERHFAQVLADSNIKPLVVSARAKTADSVRGKLLSKAYRRPKQQMMDQVGLRVILYHGHEVDAVAELFRNKLVVREKHSSDKRLALGLREFGYRSYHLVGSLPDAVTTAPELWSLRGELFEVQIRSLLEHVWAEIEHEVVYKSGADWPTEIRRRFASVAAVLELLEHEFNQLEVASTRLIDEARVALEHPDAFARQLDVPLMCAFLEVNYPEGLSFRSARKQGRPFPPGIERLLVLALRRARIETVRALRNSLRTSRIRLGLRRYAVAEQIAVAEVSHLAIVSTLLASRSPRAFRVFFPELAGDSSIQMALGRS